MPKETLNAQDVIEFLQQNPDQLLDNDSFWNALVDLYVDQPSQSFPALQHKQMALLRQRNDDLKGKIQHLLANGHVNDSLFKKMERAVLKLTGADTFSAFLAAFEQSCYQVFQVAHARLIVLAEGESDHELLTFIGDNDSLQDIQHLSSLNSTLCGPLRDTEKRYFFDQRASRIKSSAVIPLRLNEKTLGLLVFGSDDAHHFSSDQDTLFIDFFAKVLLQQMLKHIPTLPH